MAEFVGNVVALGSIAVFLWAVIGIFSPHTAKLSGRGQAVGLWAVSIVMALTAGAILPTDPPTSAEPVQVEATLSEDAAPEDGLAEQSSSYRRRVQASNERFVSQVDYGEDWPFSVKEGVLSCDPSRRGGGRLDVVFTTGGVSYALNGTARGSGDYAEIDPIHRLAPPLGQVEPLTTIPEAERRQLFADSVDCEDNANKEAERRFPTDFAGVQMTDFTAKFEEADRLADSCKESLREGAALTEAEFDRVGDEGVELGWPPLSPMQMSVMQIIQDGLVLCELQEPEQLAAADHELFDRKLEALRAWRRELEGYEARAQQEQERIEGFVQSMLAASDADEMDTARYWYGRFSGHAVSMVRIADEAIRHMDTPPAGFTQAELDERMADPRRLMQTTRAAYVQHLEDMNMFVQTEFGWPRSDWRDTYFQFYSERPGR